MSLNDSKKPKNAINCIDFIEKYTQRYERSRLKEARNCSLDSAQQPSITTSVAVQDCMVALHHLVRALETLLPEETK